MKKINLIDEQTEFLNKLEVAGKSFNTVKNYRTDLNCFNKFLASKGRELIINELTLTEVKEYSAFLEVTYNSPNSIRRRVQALRIFFDHLLSKNLVEENLIKKAIVSPKVVDLPNPAEFKHIIRLNKLISQNDKSANNLERLSSFRNQILMQLIYGAGLKVSDISILSKASIMKGKDNNYRVMVAHPKRDPRTIALPQGFEAIYNEYNTLLEKQKNTDNIDFNNLLFNGNPYKVLSGGLSPRGIEILFKDFSKKLDIKVTAKSIRQACVFKWILANHSDSRIKEWLGVQPQYSLKPFHDLIKEEPAKYSYMELNDEQNS